MNSKAPRKKPDLEPLDLTDEQWDALAGLDGFTAEQLAEAQTWGTPRLKQLLAAQEDEDEPPA